MQDYRRKIGTWTAAGLLVLCLAGCGKSGETLEQQMALRSQGMQQALEGDYEGAVASYEEALELADLRAGALELDIAAYKASALYHAGEIQKAIDTFTAILDLKDSAEIRMARGLLYREAENMTAAKEDFSAAMELTGKKDKTMLGRLSYYMEDYEQAKTYLEDAVKEGDSEAVYWEAELYWQMGNIDYAIPLYQRYLEGEAPVHQEACAKVASWQMEQGAYSEALSMLEAGIAAGEGALLQELLGNEIAVYERMGDFETAKLKMESYLEHYPEDERAQREYVFLKTR